MRFRPCCLTRRSEKAVRGSEKIGDVKLNTGNVLGVEFAASTTEEAVRLTAAHIKDLSGGYICFSNVHTTVMACDDEGYRDILNGSALTFPDGAPVARLLRKQGLGAERVAGPDFMGEMFDHSRNDCGLSHFFYGSREDTLSKLKERLTDRYPGLRIAGMYSPPFRKLTEEEDINITEMIRSSGAELIWVGLGAPRQERWMAEHKGLFDGVMLGVGAGFDFHAGTVKRAPESWQKLGFEWLYRLLSDPKRLFGRYLVTNTKFILYTHSPGRRLQIF